MASGVLRAGTIELEGEVSFLTKASVPTGFMYMQLPGMDSPDTLFFGTWTDVSSDFAGDFFRVAGGSASAFESGEQLDQLQGHWHQFYILPAGAGGGSDGTYTKPSPSTLYTNWVRNPISDGVNGTPRVGAETRPINRTIKIWKKTA